MRISFTVVAVAFALFPASGQITLLNTAPTRLRSVLSLQAGPKVMERFLGGTTASTLTVYNMDLSVHRVLNLPAPPAGMEWAAFGMGYVTEAMFDIDATTIEFMLMGHAQDYSSFILKIIREDGSELFSTVGVVSPTGDSPLDIGPPIFETEDGAVMLVQDDDAAPTRIYFLPGHVPCVDACYKNAFEAATVGMEDRLTDGAGELTVLDQGGMDTMVQFALSQGASSGLLTVVDAKGRLIWSETVRGVGTLRLSIAGLAAGVYQVSIAQDHGTPLNTRLLVLR
jgi:hypothetical protein